MSRLPIRVVKIGGSLLELAELPQRLHNWLAKQSAAHHVLIAGGGKLVEQLRSWHRLRSLDDAAAHWMCVDLMTITAHLLQSWLPEVPLVEDDQELCQRVSEQGCTIFAPGHWLRQSEPHLPGIKLPPDWDVTSDSIAARVAVVLHADELVLLKSAAPTAGASLAQLAAAGYVDRFLPTLAEEITKFRFVNLRVVSGSQCGEA